MNIKLVIKKIRNNNTEKQNKRWLLEKIKKQIGKSDQNKRESTNNIRNKKGDNYRGKQVYMQIYATKFDK